MAFVCLPWPLCFQWLYTLLLLLLSRLESALAVRSDDKKGLAAKQANAKNLSTSVSWEDWEHAGKYRDPLPVHKHINMPTWLQYNKFFFLEAAVLKHIKLEHLPTSKQVKEVKNKARLINLNCSSYTESGETLRLPCPVVGCPINTVCYRNLTLLTTHIKK